MRFLWLTDYAQQGNDLAGKDVAISKLKVRLRYNAHPAHARVKINPRER